MNPVIPNYEIVKLVRERIFLREGLCLYISSFWKNKLLFFIQHVLNDALSLIVTEEKMHKQKNHAFGIRSFTN